MITTANGEIIADGFRITASAAKHWRIYEKEIETYLRELPRLLAEGHADQYALIKGAEILGLWEDESDATRSGREKFGHDPIFVMKIDRRDPERYARLMPILKSLCQP